MNNITENTPLNHNSIELDDSVDQNNNQICDKVLSSSYQTNYKNTSTKDMKKIEPSSFFKRECIEFIKETTKQEQNECSICKMDSKYHGYKTGTYDDDNQRYENATKAVPTDAYGKIKFSSSSSKKAEYIRLEKSTNADIVLKFMLNTWNLKPPELIISVTGAAMSFKMKEEMKDKFKGAFIKAAKRTKAWITSGGTNFGVMRLVGEAIKEDLYPDIPLIGIATWGVVAGREKLVRTQGLEKNLPYECKYKSELTSKNNEAALNPVHNYFILVDDASVEKFTVEIGFRTLLEIAIQKNSTESKEIPMILIVVEGGIGTIETVKNALEAETPVILIEGSGGCADLILEAWRIYLKNPAYEFKQDFIEQYISGLDEKKKKDGLEHLNNILKTKEFDKFVNKFDLNDQNNNMETIIMNALLNSNFNKLNLVKLAIKWDQILFAKMDSMKDSKFNSDDMNELLETALLANRPEFVDLLLENGANFAEYLTTNNLERLYNYGISKKRYDEPLLIYFKDKYLIDTSESCNIKINDVNKFIKTELFDVFELPNSVNEPELNLFIWALLTNRIQIATMFWKLGNNQISNALIAAKFLSFFADKIHDLKSNMEKSAHEFETLAIHILQTFDSSTRDIVNDVLLIRYIEMVKMDVLQLAVHCDCKEFISQPIVQNVIDHIWKGKRYNQSELKDEEKNLKECQKTNNQIPNYIFNNFDMCQKTSKTSFAEKLKFPISRLIINFIYNCIFLIFFMYTLLLFPEFETVTNEMPTKMNESFKDIQIKNKTLKNISDLNVSIENQTINTLIWHQIRVIGYITFSDIIIFAWIIGLFAEEMRQIFSNGNLPCVNRTKVHFKNMWNWVDLIGCLIFFIAIFLKLISAWPSQVIFEISKIFYCIDLIVWCLRSLHFCFLFPRLGPKLVMIRKMIVDLLVFLVIILNFALAFGVALQALVLPENPTKTRYFFTIFDIAYWSIFGHVDLFDRLKKCSENSNEEKNCPTKLLIHTGYIGLMIYMIISSVLLINLLIAIFSYTFQKIQEKTDLIWKTQRLKLIWEYMNYPLLPPPFNLIVYVWRYLSKENISDNRSDEDKADYLMEFEKNCMNKYFREKRDENSVDLLIEYLKNLEKEKISENQQNIIKKFIENSEKK